jgi:hypothetical protein
MKANFVAADVSPLHLSSKKFEPAYAGCYNY